MQIKAVFWPSGLAAAPQISTPRLTVSQFVALKIINLFHSYFNLSIWGISTLSVLSWITARSQQFIVHIELKNVRNIQKALLVGGAFCIIKTRLITAQTPNTCYCFQ